jgi:hypothetical protein
VSEVLIGYPTGWTLAVVDDPAAATEVRTALVRSGLDERDVVAIHGSDASAELRRLGAASGVLARLRRSVQFLMMDQLPDFVVYEAALEDGRAIVAFRDGERGPEAVAVLRRHRAHFINRFGALMTADIEPWRGPMPPVPHHMTR